jgi:hypothetical protein
MGSVVEVLGAQTVEELRRKFSEAAKRAKAQGLEPCFGFDLEKVRQTPEGFEISFRASN